jgi:sugar phosphate isomerase/epimerase
MDWQPKGGILAEGAENEPTKPSEPGSVGFEGVTSADSPEIEAETEQARSARRLLNRAGVRIMILESGATIGVWSDLDGPEIRAALRTLGNAELPVRYLDGAGVPMHCKARRVAGEPVPMSVLSEMERNPADPWMVRDRMLNEMGWGRITAAAIRQTKRDLGKGGKE